VLHPASGESGWKPVGTMPYLNFRAMIVLDGEVEMRIAL
jgi:hypothetical protein